MNPIQNQPKWWRTGKDRPQWKRKAKTAALRPDIFRVLTTFVEFHYRTLEPKGAWAKGLRVTALLGPWIGFWLGLQVHCVGLSATLSVSSCSDDHATSAVIDINWTQGLCAGMVASHQKAWDAFGEASSQQECPWKRSPETLQSYPISFSLKKKWFEEDHVVAMLCASRLLPPLLRSCYRALFLCAAHNVGANCGNGCCGPPATRFLALLTNSDLISLFTPFFHEALSSFYVSSEPVVYRPTQCFWARQFSYHSLTTHFLQHTFLTIFAFYLQPNYPALLYDNPHTLI